MLGAFSQYIQLLHRTVYNVPCLIATRLRVSVCLSAVRTLASMQPASHKMKPNYRRHDNHRLTGNGLHGNGLTSSHRQSDGSWRRRRPARTDGRGRLSSIGPINNTLVAARPPPAGVKMKLDWLCNRRQISHLTVARWRHQTWHCTVVAIGRGVNQVL